MSRAAGIARDDPGHDHPAATVVPVSGIRDLPISAPSLSFGDAHRLWIGVLARQGLAGGTKHTSVHAVADRSLGLHSARRPSPFTTALARVAQASIADEIFTHGAAEDALVTVRCMRKTLHTLPMAMAQLAHTATRHYRERDARRIALNAGVNPQALAKLVDQIVVFLSDTDTASHREIEGEIHQRTRESATAVRAALKFAWEAGHLVYRNASAHWNRERRQFALAASAAPRITATGDQAEAAAALIELYFDRYGPATIRDAMWWSGLSRAAVVTGLRMCGRPVAAVQTPWCPDPLYLFDDRHADQLQASDPTSTVDFLAHEDVALKAYHQTRARYLGDIEPTRAFNQIGEVLPTILRDGSVIGTWRWETTTRRVQWHLFTPEAAAKLACASRADELTAALRSRYDG